MYHNIGHHIMKLSNELRHTIFMSFAILISIIALFYIFTEYRKEIVQTKTHLDSKPTFLENTI